MKLTRLPASFLLPWRNKCIHAYAGWCLRERESLEARRYMHTTYVYAAKNGLRTKERSCEFIARAPLCPMRARVHVNLRPASRSHESVLSSSSSDSRSSVDDASSRASRSESPLPCSLSFLLSYPFVDSSLFSSCSFACPSFRSLFLSLSL